MDEIWRRIEAWLSINAPDIAKGLQAPAPSTEFDVTEKLLGITFPSAFREAYSRHNGQSPDSPGLFAGWGWLSLQRIRDEWKVWKDLLDGGDFTDIESDGDGKTVRSDWWNPGWIPLTYNGCGDNHCLDLAPAPKGAKGQIIEMWHDDSARQVVATSLLEWLRTFADELEAGEYVVSEEFGGLCRKDEL